MDCLMQHCVMPVVECISQRTHIVVCAQLGYLPRIQDVHRLYYIQGNYNGSQYVISLCLCSDKLNVLNWATEMLLYCMTVPEYTRDIRKSSIEKLIIEYIDRINDLYNIAHVENLAQSVLYQLLPIYLKRGQNNKLLCKIINAYCMIDNMNFETNNIVLDRNFRKRLINITKRCKISNIILISRLIGNRGELSANQEMTHLVCRFLL